ncbi:MAG: hypothetical protein R6U95_08550 [Bacteroidales bacterium]
MIRRIYQNAEIKNGKIKGEVIDYFQSETILKEIKKHPKAVEFEGNLVYLRK